MSQTLSCLSFPFICQENHTVRECKNVQLLHFFAEIRKTLKGTREANFGRIRALGIRNLLNFF